MSCRTRAETPVRRRAARDLSRASGVIAASVLLDSAMEHYRGSFHNKAMFAPLAASTACLLAGLHGAADRGHGPLRSGARRARNGAFGVAAAVGVIGTGFHIYNVAKQPGGFTFENLFYSAPIGAPGALVLSGMLGFLGERLRETRPRVAGLPAGPLIAATSAVGLLGAAAEAGLLHLRGAFQDPFMVLPITVPPAAAAALAAAALAPSSASTRLARWWLRLTAAVGLAGTGFHIWGIHRHMGGWRNWRQNVLAGPPMPAPPAFTGLALAGLAALDLLTEGPA